MGPTTAVCMSHHRVLALYAAHQQDLLAYARRIVRDSARAEDITQDAYLRFSDATREEWPDNPVAYLYRIVRNLAMDSHRRSRFESDLFTRNVDDIADTQPCTAPSVEQQTITSDELERLHTALTELPSRTRVAVEMHRLGGYKLREIAAHLNVSTSMAQHLVKEGIKHCQQRLYLPEGKQQQL